jgi:succinate dehydrogenase / fumarate reductase membrane anchor subunit
MKLRSDLSRVLGLGSARSGSHHWIHQRMTAIAIVPLALWFVTALLTHMRDDVVDLTNWIRSPFVTVLLVSLIGAMFYHAKLGLQVVIEDYVHAEVAKVALLIAMKLGCVFGALLGIVSVLKISFGMT